MAKIALILVVFVLVIHGLIHLMGTAVYMRLADISGLSYKTTLLDGHWDLGARGILVFGALWILPAVGFVAAAVALLAGWEWWRPLLEGVALLSLALAGLDWSNALGGAIVDMAILSFLWVGPHLAGYS